MASKKHQFIAFVFCFALLVSLSVSASVGWACADNPTNSRLIVDIWHGKQVFRYIDHTVKPTNYLMELDFCERGINADIDQKIRLMLARRAEGYSAEQCIDWFFPNFRLTVERAARALDVPATDSRIKFRPNQVPMFVISRERNGTSLCRSQLYVDAFHAIIRGQRNIRARVDTVAPSVTAEQNAECTYLRAKFATSFASSIPARKHNIRLALGHINGTVIAPRGEFSFNRIVGARTTARGFQEAKIIMRGQFVEGVGGGVCQVSTTMYNTALRADMNITTVRNHSLPVSYVPPSMDAMVNSGSSDLTWVNTTTQPVFVRAYATPDDHAVIEIFGQAMPYHIRTESEVVEQLPPPERDDTVIDHTGKYTSPTDPPGTRVRVSEPRGGLVSRGYLVFVDFRGNVIMRRHIRTDKYTPQRGLVAVVPQSGHQPAT